LWRVVQLVVVAEVSAVVASVVLAVDVVGVAA